MTGEDDNDDIGAAFKKFAVVTKELSAQMRNLVGFVGLGPAWNRSS